MDASLYLPSERERLLIGGPAGAVDLFVDAPPGRPRGLALIGHSHPLLGGTPEDQVTAALAQTLCELGYVCLRPWFRGTGRTAGGHGNGDGEAQDMLAVHDYALRRFGGLPVLLCGFSFGAFVQSKLATRLEARSSPPAEVILASTALGNVRNVRFYDTDPLPASSVLIHGTLDDRVPFQNVLEWAGRQALPVLAVPGADHFFNDSLDRLRQAVRIAARLRPAQGRGG